MYKYKILFCFQAYKLIIIFTSGSCFSLLLVARCHCLQCWLMRGFKLP